MSCREDLSGRISSWCSTAHQIIAALISRSPNNVSLLFLPPYAPELNPKENLWDEIREKIFKNYAIKSIEAVYRKLEEAILYIERNSELVKSITSFPYIVNSL